MACHTWLLLLCVALWMCVGVSSVETIEELSAKVSLLSRQVMNQELSAHEKIRSEGDSGLKLIRLRTKGTHSYDSQSVAGQSIASMHDHANNDRTIGSGELIVVLNGYEFRTRHNDYRLTMPNTTSTEWNAVEDLPFPAVPPEVLGMNTVDEQIVEMQEWFKAWQSQDDSVRDYKQYFKAVLCYLEGAWTTETTAIEEPFYSDRHALDGISWSDLLAKIRFTSATGKKDNNENFAYLPTTLMSLINDTEPEYAQWNYRILCHPLNSDLPLNRLGMIDDLANRMANNVPIEEHSFTRCPRFQISATDAAFHHDRYNYAFLDDLMGEIPGKDSYGGYIEDSSIDLLSADYNDLTKMLNVAYYHRVLSYRQDGAMGEKTVHRGFNDQNLFVAYTNHQEVSEVRLQRCTKQGQNIDCSAADDTARVSYAIPLEIIYLTPLYEWNPYNIEHKGDFRSVEAEAVVAATNGIERTGGLTVQEAYNGTDSKRFYRIPSAFFATADRNPDPADTTRDEVGVLDIDENLRIVTGSGTRVLLPDISGIGPVRVRYSIAPLYDDGNSIKKELDALREVVLDLQQNRYMLRDPPPSLQYNAVSVTEIWLVTDENADSPYQGNHTHRVALTVNDMMNLIQGETIRKYTTLDSQHTHDMKIIYANGGSNFKIDECDGDNNCWHSHGNWLTELI